MTSGMRSPRLSEKAISGLIDPRTQQPLRPLGVIGGRLVWPMMGASPDDPSDTGSGGGGGGTDDNPEGGKSGSGSGGGDTGGNTGDPQAKIQDLEEEKDRHVRRRQEAETERDELKQRLAEIEGKDATELEKANNRVSELETQLSALEESLQAARLENAFFKDNTYTWHNPSRALALADLSDVEFDKDGNVTGLNKALDKLAKSDAYLLKTEETKKEDPPNTGDPKNPSTKDKKDESADDKTKRLKGKYPALQR